MDDSLLDNEPAYSADSPTATRSRTQSKHDGPSSSSRTPTEANTTREESLRQELANVKKVNQAIEGVIESLTKAKSNMKTVDQTVGAASALLNTWTKILSQTEHNQRLILDPTWQGATQDIADMEEETQAKQNAAERRALEEQERKADLARKAEEDERRRAEAATRASKTPTRGRGRGLSRGSSTSYATPASAASANTSTSSIARGSSSTRRGTGGIGRLRGVRGRT